MSALKQAVQNMYDGELIILGDPSVKPYDYVYLADVANSMSGMFEVETVVHLISKSTGFITSITPAPIVSVNEGAQGRCRILGMVQEQVFQYLSNNSSNASSDSLCIPDDAKCNG